MSKLATIKAFQRDPRYAGDFFSKIVKGAKSLFAKGKKVAAGVSQFIEQAAPTAAAAVEGLINGGGGGGGGGTRRRRRGITALELRGYRKVSNLLHKEGMVSKRARGRKS